MFPQQNQGGGVDPGDQQVPWYKRLGHAAAGLPGGVPNNSSPPFYGNPGGASGVGGPMSTTGAPTGARPGYGNLGKSIGDFGQGLRQAMLNRARTRANNASMGQNQPPGLTGAPPPPMVGGGPTPTPPGADGRSMIAQPPAPSPVSQFPPPDGQDFPAQSNPTGYPQALAEGGIVDKPTKAILGERGPEAVIPLGFQPEAKVKPGLMATYGGAGRRAYGQDQPGERQGMALNMAGTGNKGLQTSPRGRYGMVRGKSDPVATAERRG